MGKKSFILSLIFVMITALSGCSGGKMSDQQVIDDVKEYFCSGFPNTEFDDVDLEIEKRQTNTEEKTDYSWISLTAENDDVSVDASYEVVYVNYNEGWQMEECEQTG